ncbi:ferritin-like domain-containing protein [Daejeonella oryzae]|uniref:ferritin-like domain-containing protein n=1 Tax=Daejeonella oryzae TaxID=1122943 RepID=UPI00041D4E34|nr:ferritin-like domain-containing protein [Daejeonella oryzae]
MANLTKTDEQGLLKDQKDFLSATLHRRSFLQYAGAGAAGIALVAAGCKKDRMIEGVYLGSGDIGILNYAYALEQLEAAFYLQVATSFYSGATDAEKLLLSDIRDHEVAHREFFKNALGTMAIPALEVDFSTINFGSRDSVLATAKAFEDLGVSAYNGAGALIKDAGYLTLAGKIVSVEARHAALIRDLISNGSFANSEVIDSNGLDKSRLPMEVLGIAGTYIKTKINASDLPTS